MRKIYACMDIGSHSIKIVVTEKCDEKFVVLSRFIVKSKGVAGGKIVNEEEALFSVKKAIDMVQKDLGITLTSVLCVLPSESADFRMVRGETAIHGPIGQQEITKVLQDAVSFEIEEDRVLVSIHPVFYSVDDRENLKDVRGMSGTTLGVKAVIATLEKSYARSFSSLLKRLGIELVDVELSLVGDYYAIKNPELDRSVVGLINIGYDKTEIGIFNKGILIKSESIDIGSRMVDKDIAFHYHLERKKCRYLKETFAVSNTRYADVNEKISIQNREGVTITINQLQISEIVEARIYEILKLAKKQISILTNREIRYIIVTGGISEIAGFEYTLENVFGRQAFVLSENDMGVRSNSYSSCFGFTKCFSERLELRDKAYSMIRDTDIEGMGKRGKKTASEGGLGGLINYFTGNKED